MASDNFIADRVDPVKDFADRLRRLQVTSGGPSVRDLERLTDKLGMPYTRGTIQDKLSGRSTPAWEFVEAFVRACAVHAGLGEPDLRPWRGWHGQMTSERAATRAAGRRISRPDVCPYLGLETFTAAEAEWFHGRSVAVQRVLAGLAAHRQGVLLLGPSGSGKSSLARAGVLPALAAGRLPNSDRWKPELVHAGSDLRAVLGRPELLTTGDVGRAAGERLLLVVDQFEELLTPSGPANEDHDEVIDEFTAVIGRPAVTVLVVIRDDFYPRLASQAPTMLESLAPGLVNVPATLSTQDLRDIITRPADSVGLGIQDGLTERIIADLLVTDTEPVAAGHAPTTVLPLLELTLHQLWQRRHDGHLTHEAYDRIGGVTGGLASYCDTVVDTLPVERQSVAQHLLTALVRPADEAHGIPAVRQQVDLLTLRELAAGPSGDRPSRVFDEVLATLTAHRVVTTHATLPAGHPDDASGAPVAELVHDALIRDWGTLASWVRQDHRFHDWRRRTEEQRARWATRHDPGDLLRGTDLAEGLDWSDRRRLPDSIAEFVAASHLQQRAGIRRTRRLNMVLASLFVMALAASVLALWQRESAVTAQRVALSRQLAAQSTSLTGADPDLAALLAVEAYRTSPTAEATNSLYAAAARPLLHRLAGHTQRVRSVAFSPDGRTLATGSDDGTVRLWDVGSGKPGTILTGRTGGVLSVAFSPDGQTLATAGTDRVVTLWDVATATNRTTMVSHNGYVLSVAFSPDGQTLATGGADGAARLWDPSTGHLRATLTGHTGYVYSVTFSPDGHTLATAGVDGTARLWDTTTRRTLRTLNSHAGKILSVAFSPDGQTLATGGEDDAARLWDVGTGHPHLRATLTGHTGYLYSVNFSPDGHTLATGGDDNTIRIWDVATGRTRITLNSSALSAAFSPDGHALATGGVDGIVRLWDPANGQARTTLTGHTSVGTVGFSPDGRTLASSGEDGAVKLWDAVSGQLQTTLAGRPVASDGAAFSPDGLTIASNGGGMIQLWDLASRQRRAQAADPTGDVYTMTFSPDGSLLATTGVRRTVWVWGVAGTQLRVKWVDDVTTDTTVAFSPDGRLLATGGFDRTVRLLDAASGRIRRTLTGHTGTVNSVAFSPDGRILASGGGDGAVRLWDVANGTTRLALTGPTGPVYAVAFSPDGDTLATGSDDATVRLWDVATGQLRVTLTGHTGPVTSVAFSPDGHTLASGSTDQTVRVWNVTLPSLSAAITSICHAENRDLTAPERAMYLPANLMRSTGSA